MHAVQSLRASPKTRRKKLRPDGPKPRQGWRRYSELYPLKNCNCTGYNRPGWEGKGYWDLGAGNCTLPVLGILRPESSRNTETSFPMLYLPPQVTPNLSTASNP